MISFIKKLPLIKFLRKIRFEKRFASDVNVNYFRGVYNNFTESAATSPSTKPIGYDNSSSAKMYQERLQNIYSTDYPVLYWMEKYKTLIKRVFDFGGHVGVHYYTYSKYSPIPADAEWTVCDVESVVKEGKLLAVERGATNLNFAHDISECESYDLLLANGSLQYLEWELHDKLKQIKTKPKLVIVNTTPMHPHLKTITLQSIGTSFCPYYVRLEKDFITGMQSIGYELLDIWKNEEKKCLIAFEEERSLSYYRGACFILNS